MKERKQNKNTNKKEHVDINIRIERAKN